MTKNLHGIIFAYHAARGLGELVSCRTSASIPFCGRYRLIDFPLSSMTNSGVRDVGVIMRQDYQSLLDHLGSGKEWDLSKKRGGLKLLPPFASDHGGNFTGTIEALCTTEDYIRDIKQDYVVLARGNTVANVDIRAAMARHLRSGADVTAICADFTPSEPHERYLVDENGMVKELLYRRTSGEEGYASLEMYIMSKDLLLRIMERCSATMRYKFHKDVMSRLLADGGKIAVYMHEGYAAHISTVSSYYKASMDMLDGKKRAGLFPAARPVRTKGRADVSTYYSERAKVKNSLVADGCFVEGNIENSILFRGARIEHGATIKNSIIMQDTVIGEGAELFCVISDKDVSVSPFITLAGSPELPLVIPKGSKI